MPERICILLGHPHSDSSHFCHALAASYAKGAETDGAIVERIDVGRIAPVPLADPADFATPPDDPRMLAAREVILRAEHLVIVFPLWLGTMPAMLKAFFEQMARDEFALGVSKSGWPAQHLKGRSARIIVTMGMPALAYRLWFLNAGVSNLRRMILGMSGVGPVRQTTIGGIGNLDAAGRAGWLERVEALGRARR